MSYISRAYIAQHIWLHRTNMEILNFKIKILLVRNWKEIIMLMQLNGILELIQVRFYFNLSDNKCEV